jgi:LmbE family N-acetylglucosaminyl deacetylase
VWTRRRFLAFGAKSLGLALAGGVFDLLDHPFNPVRAADVPVDPILGPARRVGVVAPHPDDELLGPGGVSAMAARSGARVDVLLLTMGDGFALDAMRVFATARPTPAEYRALGEARHGESRRAMAALGLDPESLTALGFPDRGSGHLWYGDWRAAYRSPTTGANRVPYADAVAPGTPYTGRDYLEGIAAWLDAARPDVLFLPHPDDEHPDHRYGYCFCSAALDRLRAAGRAWVGGVRRLTYLVHWGRWNLWPLPFGDHPGLPLVPPSQLVGRGMRWERRDLPADVERLKRHATSAYRTQMELVGAFLLAFSRRNELFDRDEPHPVPRLGEADGLASLAPVVRNPRMGFLQDLTLRAADFGGVALALFGDRLWVRVGFAEPHPPASVTARVDVLGVPDDGVPRGVEVEVRAHPAEVLAVRRLGWEGGAGPAGEAGARTRQGGLEVDLPVSLLEGASRFLLGVRSFASGRPAAASGWRRFVLQPERGA